MNKANQTAYEVALVSHHHSVASIIESHKSDHVVPFRETPAINPKRRSIYLDQQEQEQQQQQQEREKCRARSSSHTTPSSSLTSRSQSMPKLNGLHLNDQSMRRSQSPVPIPPIEHYFQQEQANHPSSRSSSPKSFSVTSDHGLGSECASHLSSGE